MTVINADIVGDTEYLEEKHSLRPSKFEKKIKSVLSSYRKLNKVY